VIGYMPGRVGNGAEKFRLVSLHDCYVGFAGATPQFNSIGPYRFEYCFIDEYCFLVIGGEFFFPISHFISRVFWSSCFLFLATCSLQVNLWYFTVST
jgi:hypothetical protein